MQATKQSTAITTESLSSLSDEELFAVYRSTKAKRARDAIIERYSYIPKILAKKYYNKGIENDDIYQIACIGLINAVERFDETKGLKFSTFATPTIIGEIKRFFRDKGNFIKLPRKLYDIFSKASRIRAAWLMENGEEISRQQLAREMGISVKLLDEAMEWSSCAAISSLESIASDENVGRGMYHIIGQEDDAFLMIENADLVTRFMNRLDERERAFIHYRYYKEYTQREIACTMGITQMQASRIERKILSMFKDMYFKTVEC